MCKECNCIFNLSMNWKECDCGKVKGRYTDSLNAEYIGKDALMLGFSNLSFDCALMQLTLPEDIRPLDGIRFEAFIIQKPCKTFKEKIDE